MKDGAGCRDACEEEDLRARQVAKPCGEDSAVWSPYTARWRGEERRRIRIERVRSVCKAGRGNDRRPTGATKVMRGYDHRKCGDQEGE